MNHATIDELLAELFALFARSYKLLLNKPAHEFVSFEHVQIEVIVETVIAHNVLATLGLVFLIELFANVQRASRHFVYGRQLKRLY
jgi:hypothetical protein